MPTEKPIKQNHPIRGALRVWLALAGPLMALVVVGWRIIGKSENVHFYFADVRVALLEKIQI